MLKLCDVCGSTFKINNKRRRCSKECDKISNAMSCKNDYQKHRKERTQQQKTYRTKNHEELLIKSRKNSPIYRRKYKYDVVLYYSNGSMCCACCGEKHIEFLTVDHIYGDGAEHRRLFKWVSGHSLYNWLRKNNYPPGYQILCWNCNCAKYYSRVCPHKT